MDNAYQPSSGKQQPPLYNVAFLDTSYNANRPSPSEANEPTQPSHGEPRWTPSRGYASNPCRFRCDFPAPTLPDGGYRGAPSFLPYGFNPSVPPPPFGCSPPGHFPNTVPSAPVSAYSGGVPFPIQAFNQPSRNGPETMKCDQHSGQRQQQHEGEDFPESETPFGYTLLFPLGDHYNRSTGTTAIRVEDDTSFQKKQDQQWVRRFLQIRKRTSEIPQTQQSCVPDLRVALYMAAQLVSHLAECCETLRDNVDNTCVWTEFYLMALNVKEELQDNLTVLSDSRCLDSWTARMSHVAKRRARLQRARELQHMEGKQRDDHISEKETVIDKWRMHQIRQVEEKKKEQELKLAADAVLCVVRKKQADVKRMQEILRSLEKLYRLRKEAASRKGIVTEWECEQVFSSRLKQLRCVLKKRTAVYSAEENALMVMLEGEQEEERRREREKRVKKEREKQLQRKHRIDAMLFGDETPVDSALQPFREYYTQAERSLHTLLQIRREWDSYVVPVDHPDGSSVPHSWILPDSPSDQAWASALHSADAE